MVRTIKRKSLNLKVAFIALDFIRVCFYLQYTQKAPLGAVCLINLTNLHLWAPSHSHTAALHPSINTESTPVLESLLDWIDFSFSGL